MWSVQSITSQKNTTASKFNVSGDNYFLSDIYVLDVQLKNRLYCNFIRKE